jgi:hypothetical protein
MIEITFNPEEIVGKLSKLGQVQLPSAAATALNLTAFKVREALQAGATASFKEVSPFTLAAFLYKKGTPANLEASIFIRFDAPKGNAPSDYLAPHIVNETGNRNGGLAYRTRFARGLERVRDPSPIAMGGSILASNKVMTPTQSPQGVRFGARGRMTPGQYEQIFTYLANTDSTRTATTGRKSAARAGVRYFYMNQAMADERRGLRSNKPGIFKVNGGKLMRVMTEINTPSFGAKFRFFDIGAETANREFPLLLSKQKIL